MKEPIHVNSRTLRQLVEQVFVRGGVSADAARIVADNLVEANLRGVDTHGVILVETYVKRLRSGSINRRPLMRKTVDGETYAVIDADNGPGQVAGKLAMDEAIAKGMRTGVGIVAVHRSNHFGAAAYFSVMAAEQGCIGIAMSNASPRLAPWGGITPTYGNNPWSVAVPWDGGFPIVLDMANSVVAFSKILTARRNGQPIPDGWALDGDGKMTRDPHAAEVLLPVGGHKGYGIAFMVEVFAGILSNAAIGKDVGKYDALDRGQNVGHLFMAIDIERFMPKKEFSARLSYFVGQIRQSQRAAGVETIFLPGEIEALTKREREKNGIPLPMDVWFRLEELAGLREGNGH